MRIRVYYEDTDLAGVVYYANYFKFIERARSELFFSRGVLPIDGTSHFVVRSVNADFMAPAKFGDELDIVTKLLEMKSASVVLKQDIYRGGQLLFSSTVKLVHLDKDKPAKIPENLKQLFENSDK
jgi:acyl-CoA thioester hydrolase